MNAIPEAPLGQHGIAPAAVPATRPLYWSVRREIWENHAIYIAPVAVACVFLFGFLISLVTLPERMRAAMTLGAAKQHHVARTPFDVAAFMILVTSFIVGVFYCLDALHGERRDRSILFWKSLPVSDLTTVFSKACVPLAVLPLCVFSVILFLQIVMAQLSTLVLLGSGISPAVFWSQLKLVQSSVALFYALTVVALWHAPIYGWLLLISAWAKRATFLWAVLPVFAIFVLERIAFGSMHFAYFLRYRLIGWFQQAFILGAPGAAPANPLDLLAPGKFVTTPSLWLGLLFAAGCLAAAVRLRRYREPI
jgi:ABC-2 type transport system permease protein